MPVLIPTAGQQLAVNGTDLSQLAVVVFSKAPLMATPKKRGANVSVPGRHGTIRTPRKRFEENDLVLKCYVLGSSPDGTVPPGSSAAAELYARADALLRVFAADTVLLTRTMPDGSQRQAVAEVVDSMDWTRQLGSAPLLAQVNIALTIPSAFWSDAATVTQTVTGTTGAAQALTAFVGATAPMADLAITFTGPISNPTLTHGSRYVTYNGVISAGRQLVLNTTNWTVSPGTGTSWSPDPRQVSFGPGPTWLELDPNLNPFQVVLTHTGGGSASCSIAGQRKFLSA